MNHFSFYAWLGLIFLLAAAPEVVAAEGAIRGALRTDSRPAANVKVSLSNSKQQVSEPTYTDKKGMFVFRGVDLSERYILNYWNEADEINKIPLVVQKGRSLVDIKPMEVAGGINSPVLSNEEVESFVKKHMEAFQKGDINTLMSGYANLVSYYDNGDKNKTEIAKDQGDYIKHFEKRVFTVREIQVFGTQNSNIKWVRFSFDFKVFHHDKLVKSGTSWEVWSVRKTGRKIEVTDTRSDITGA